MLVVRKEGKQHDKYNSFRSAFELLEAVGRDPQDCFDEKNEDLPPLRKLEQRMEQRMEQRIDHMRMELMGAVGRNPQDCFNGKDEDLSPLQKLEQRMERMQQSMQQQLHQQQLEMNQQIDNLRSENEILRSRLNDVVKKLER